jgi:long-subunit fatty acid transport protein
VQLEGVVSYDVTPAFSVGVGGRYWAMQSTGKTPLCTRVPEQLLDLQVEQSALFVQGSYKFAGPSD